MGDVKLYLVEGEMMIAHDRLPTWQKFRVVVRAIKPEHAIEYAYSVLGSRHKVKRKHIRIEKVSEITPDIVKDRSFKMLEALTKVVIQ